MALIPVAVVLKVEAPVPEVMVRALVPKLKDEAALPVRLSAPVPPPLRFKALAPVAAMVPAPAKVKCVASVVMVSSEATPVMLLESSMIMPEVWTPVVPPSPLTMALSVRFKAVLTLPVPVALIVIVSVVASVVMEVLVPATKVKVSLLVSVTTVLCPATAMFLKMFWLDPKSVLAMVMVSVAESPVMEIPAPAVRVKVSVVESATGDVPEVVLKVEKTFWSPVLVPEDEPEKLEAERVPVAVSEVKAPLAGVVAPI